MKDLGIVFSTNDAYAWQTCVAMVSILDNNRCAPEDKQVKLHIYVYAEDYSQTSKENKSLY